MDIEITGLSRVVDPKPNKKEDTIIAFFDCTIGPVALRGCALTIRKCGFVTIWEPKIADGHKQRSVYINDRDLKGEIVVAAQAAFEAMGGAKSRASR
ncbi:hypothetical protein [Sulfitobacter guttiformis]|uniref:Uncharacterized protein n=1 Tax=Sulfitobacter guttiformis TaxID=74349 RepID=A0A420DHL3_9RHOB|nr:hypothetical protein [Sulfitobacter guttiformis]KIN72557.1 hypothetical protein Z949_1734 [Sulfitobacter guttiformis KCTC 32187]RKE93697.1 hypothetical protein C8N30_2787 [Sulfitobacter guttiformis]